MAYLIKSDQLFLTILLLCWISLPKRSNEETLTPLSEVNGQGNLKHEKEAEAEPEVKRNASVKGAWDDSPVFRTVPDTRLPHCKFLKYSANLPKVSVVIIYWEKNISALFHTLTTLFERTPPLLLEEIVLTAEVADEGIQRMLLANKMNKVRYFENFKLYGGLRSRAIGALHAQGEVIVFLDYNCEVNINWLPPLLTVIADNEKTIALPVVDDFDSESSKLYSPDPKVLYKGIFDWSLNYKEIPLSEDDIRLMKYEGEPYNTPVFHSRMLAISRKYFWEIGANKIKPSLELSFKVWLCGGRILRVPCSRIGRYVRPTNRANNLKQLFGGVFLYEYKYIVEAWFDNKYKKYFYLSEPLAHTTELDVKKYIPRVIRNKEELKCSNFEWYMQYVAQDVLNAFPPPPPNDFVGLLISKSHPWCLTPTVYESVIMRVCSYSNALGLYSFNYAQTFILDTHGRLRVANRCILSKNNLLYHEECALGSTSGPWKYNQEERSFIYGDTGKCLGFDPNEKRAMLKTCDKEDVFQQWSFLRCLHLEVPCVAIIM